MTTLAFPKPSPRTAVAALVFGAVFVGLFWHTFAWMAERFRVHDTFYSHGWLIPFACAWLIWQRRARLAGLPAGPSYAGLALLAPAMLVHVLATLWDVHFVSGFAMLAVVWGLVWTLWGGAVLWALRFPMLYLVFMVPLPSVLLIAASFAMKMWAASLATGMIHAMGIPAVQAGSMIHVPGVSVIVDDTCSGLRSLISLIALSVLWVSLLPAGAKRWHKLAIVVASVPIALAANMARIMILVLTAAIYGSKVAEGYIHYGSGFVVFGVALAALAGLSRVLAGRSASTAPVGRGAS